LLSLQHFSITSNRMHPVPFDTHATLQH